MNFFINYLHFLKGFLNDLKMPFDLLITFFHSGRNYFSNSKDFYDVLHLTEGQQIKQNFKDFLANQKIREDLLVIPVPQQITFAAGINFSLNKKSSHAAIFLSKGLNQLDSSAFSFIFKHEISHIKNCDVYVQKLLVLITTLASSPLFFYGLSCQSWAIAIIQAFLVMLMPMQIFIGNPYMEFREKKADDFAVKYSTKEEIQGFLTA